jgi:hypothetical protein
VTRELLDELELTDSKLFVKSKLIIGISILLIVTMPVSFLSAIIEVESIIVTGVVASFIGLVLLIIGLIKKRIWAISNAVNTLLAVLVVFASIWIFELSPSEAKKPVPWLILFFTLTSWIFGFFTLVTEFKSRDKNRIVL